MNGCQYQQSTFTLPAGSSQISQMKWDLAFLSREDFAKKYKISLNKYDRLVKFVKE